LNFLTLILIAFGLSLDAFAVSIASGFTIKERHLQHAFTMAFFFGFFQAVMPVAGWAAGKGLAVWIAEIDHWIAFGILTFIGMKMILESKWVETPSENVSVPGGWGRLTLLAIATSIDALAVGLSLGVIRIPIIYPAILIGGVTFGVSLSGVWVGNRFGHLFERQIEVVGGLILIGIGIQILFSHL